MYLNCRPEFISGPYKPVVITYQPKHLPLSGLYQFGMGLQVNKMLKQVQHDILTSRL